jgi:hypothetical protein
MKPHRRWHCTSAEGGPRSATDPTLLTAGQASCLLGTLPRPGEGTNPGSAARRQLPRPRRHPPRGAAPHRLVTMTSRPWRPTAQSPTALLLCRVWADPCLGLTWSIRASRVVSRTEPSGSTGSWKARRLTMGPSSSSVGARPWREAGAMGTLVGLRTRAKARRRKRGWVELPSGRFGRYPPSMESTRGWGQSLTTPRRPGRRVDCDVSDSSGATGHGHV